MKTVDTVPGGGAAALVGFPMKSSKCKFILLRGINLHDGVLFPCGFFSFSYLVVLPVTLNINQIFIKVNVIFLRC